MDKKITVRVSPETYEWIDKEARKSYRSLSKQVAYILSLYKPPKEVHTFEVSSSPFSYEPPWERDQDVDLTTNESFTHTIEPKE